MEPLRHRWWLLLMLCARAAAASPAVELIAPDGWRRISDPDRKAVFETRDPDGEKIVFSVDEAEAFNGNRRDFQAAAPGWLAQPSVASEQLSASEQHGGMAIRDYCLITQRFAGRRADETKFARIAGAVYTPGWVRRFELVGPSQRSIRIREAGYQMLLHKLSASYAEAAGIVLPPFVLAPPPPVEISLPPGWRQRSADAGFVRYGMTDPRSGQPVMLSIGDDELFTADADAFEQWADNFTLYDAREDGDVRYDGELKIERRGLVRLATRHVHATRVDGTDFYRVAAIVHAPGHVRRIVLTAPTRDALSSHAAALDPLMQAVVAAYTKAAGE